MFTCPLCRYVINSYNKNPLTVNKEISKLLAQVDCLRFPVKEKSSLTDPLLLRHIETQSSDYEKQKEFNEYITIVGIALLLLLFLP